MPAGDGSRQTPDDWVIIGSWTCVPFSGRGRISDSERELLILREHRISSLNYFCRSRGGLSPAFRILSSLFSMFSAFLVFISLIRCSSFLIRASYSFSSRVLTFALFSAVGFSLYALTASMTSLEGLWKLRGPLMGGRRFISFLSTGCFSEQP